MPNWSSTKITLTGKEEVIDELCSKMQSEDQKTGLLMGLSVFCCIEPSEEEGYESKIDDNGNHEIGDWYQWRLDNWGTKWNVSAYIIDRSAKGSVIIEFNSAWSGPDKWFRSICKELKLDGIYLDFESGVDFFHVIEYRDGVFTENIDDFISELSASEMGKDWVLDNLMWMLDGGHETEKELLEEYTDLRKTLGICELTLTDFYEYAENAGYEIQWLCEETTKQENQND